MVTAVVVVVVVVGSATALTIVVVTDPSAVVVGAKAVTAGSAADVVELSGCDEVAGTGSIVVPPHPAMERITNGAVRRKPL